jgi:putative acetyltransferase
MTADEMARPDTTVFIARIGGEAVAMGALRRHGGGIGEVKRMYTRPAWQGRGIGRAILDAIQETAEMGGRQPPRSGNRPSPSRRLARL